MASSSPAASLDEVIRSIYEGRAPEEITLEDFLLARFADAPEEEAGAAVEGGRGRKRKETVDPMDRAALQRQKRMIKNRESAARSRERKQAYTVELETMVTQLQEENARLSNEDEERKRQRHQQLMENLIPITEKKRPRRVLGRTRSMQW